MFGSPNPFGQAASSPFGSQSVFGQTSNASNNPFMPQQFGSPTPFGSQTGSSIFGGTATGMFGAAAQSSSPFPSTTTFGASSSPAFGASVPAFGASSSPAFGSSSSAFGGSSTFGQKPAFGGFASSTQPNPFGSTGQPSQPAFGSGLFGSPTPFGAPSQPAFGSTSTPSFGSTSTPAFGSTNPPAFGSVSTPAFGSTSTPAFGSTSTPAFGSMSTPAFGVASTPAFGVANAPAFGVASTPAFGVTSSPAFGSTASPAFGSTSTTFGVSSTPFGSGGGFGTSTGSSFGLSTTSAFGTSSTLAFGVSSTPTFGSSSSPAFGLSSTSSFNFSTSSAFGQPSPAFGSSPFGTATAAFGPPSSLFGSQTTTAPFGSAGFAQPGFGGQRGGSRVAPYTPTTETENAGGPPGKFESISAMPAYKDKSHEELRWEDYQLGDKGGPAPPGQSSSFGAFGAQSSVFSASTPFSSTLTSPFSTSASSNIFAPKPSTFGSSSNSAFGSTPSLFTSSSPFGSSSSSSTSPFGVSTPFGTASISSFASSSSTSPFGVSTPFGTASISSFASAPSLFNTSTHPVSTSLFNTGMSFGSSQMPLLGPTPSLGQSTASFGQSLFNTSSSGGSLFSTSSPLFSSTSAGAFGQATSSPLFTQSSVAAPTSSFTGFGQNPGLFPTGFTGPSASLGLVGSGQLPSTQSSLAVVQQMPVTNPFGILPQVPQMSIGRAGTAPAVQYGISSLPVVDKPAPVRISSLLTSRHLSQRRIRLPARKYHPKQDGLKVAFFSDEEEMPSTPKADALFVPRENPRALVIRPADQWPVRAGDKISLIKNVSTPARGNELYSAELLHIGGEASDAVNPSNLSSENGQEDVALNGGAHDTKDNQRSNGVNGDYSTQKYNSYKTLSDHRAGEASIVFEHGADIEALMPKLRHSDYYTEPGIQELAAKERAEPGFCRHVKDFVIGRHGYGCIKFLGETDVRRLDLELLVQFNNREVTVYMDDSKKPPVGQGLNKPAEVTLLNVKCFDKKTGHQYTEGPKIEKYKEMLKRKLEDQGAEFVSYDPVRGEWKFRVHHFSKYKLEEEEEEEEEEK